MDRPGAHIISGRDVCSQPRGDACRVEMSHCGGAETIPGPGRCTTDNGTYIPGRGHRFHPSKVHQNHSTIQKTHEMLPRSFPCVGKDRVPLLPCETTRTSQINSPCISCLSTRTNPSQQHPEPHQPSPTPHRDRWGPQIRSSASPGLEVGQAQKRSPLVLCALGRLQRHGGRILMA